MIDVLPEMDPEQPQRIEFEVQARRDVIIKFYGDDLTTRYELRKAYIVISIFIFVKLFWS